MHISLDSALGRQRRLNQVGETISSIANPAAAYSLRSLTGGDPKVVRVRRGSDNDEQDFTASEVASGAMLSYVNTQAIKPLDIRELTSGGSDDGRNGDFILANAAYSLRSLGTRQATIPNNAAPLNADTVVPASGKYVVQVRRNVNGDQKSFTADEVTDGTLLSFVNESFTSSLPLDVQGSAAAAYSLRNLSSSYSGNVVEVRNAAGDTQNFKASEITDGTLVDFALGNTKSLLNNRAYFDASNDEVVFSSEITMSGDFSIQYSFVVTETGRGERILGRTTTYYIAAEGSGEIDKFKAQVGSSGVTMTLTSNLKYGEENTVKFKRVSGKVGIYDESDTLISSEVTASGDFVFNAVGRARGQYAKGFVYNIRIDTNNDGTINHSYNGYGNTLSDWTDLVGSNNATTVNGSPALFTGQDQDGFVKTWYDQSGSSNNAVQATAANQPKIVENGNFLNELKFDGTNDILKTSESSTFSQPVSLFHVFNSSASVASDYQLNAGNSSMLSGSDGSIFYFAGTLLNSTIDFPTSGDTLHSVLFNGASSTVHANGTSVASGDIGSGTFSKSFGIGGRTTDSQFSDMSFKEIIIYDSNQSEDRRALEESISGHYGITLDTFNRDGFVRTWYDQSVTGQDATTGTPNANHAVQTSVSSMPKIVGAGSLLTKGLTFDGTNDFLTLTSTLGQTNLGSYFSVVELDTTNSSKAIVDNRDSANDGSTLFHQTGSFRFKFLSTTETVSSTSTSQLIASGFKTSSKTSLGINGAALEETSSTSTISVSALPTIGARSFSSSDNFMDGEIAELIIYNTDQSANRTAIEANIGSVYSIDLPSGVDPGFDQVDGFVETWYDQSGNGNDATQATASLQPKIVNAGSLLADGILFGANINLPLSGTGLDIFKNVAHGNIFSVIKPLDTGTSGDRYFSSGINTGTSARFLFGDSQDTSAAFRIGGRALDGDSFSDEEGTTTHSNAVSLLTGFINYGTKTGTLFLNGSQTDTATLSNMTAGNTSDTSSALAAIGDLQSSGALTADFNAKEMIIYNTDQSSNRTALETNINSHYSIF